MIRTIIIFDSTYKWQLTDAMKSTNRHDMPGATAIGGVTRARKDCHQEKFWLLLFCLFWCPAGPLQNSFLFSFVPVLMSSRTTKKSLVFYRIFLFSLLPVLMSSRTTKKSLVFYRIFFIFFFTCSDVQQDH